MSGDRALVLLVVFVAMIGGAAAGLVLAVTDDGPPRVRVDCTAPCMVDPRP